MNSKLSGTFGEGYQMHRARNKAGNEYKLAPFFGLASDSEVISTLHSAVRTQLTQEKLALKSEASP